MTTSLLGRIDRQAGPPPHLVHEARGWGLDLHDPVGEHWETVSDFAGLYARSATPAGILLVASDPTVGGAMATGIPFTDAVRAERLLNLPVTSAPLALGPTGVVAPAGDPASERFWGIVADAKRASGGASLEGLFSTLHLAHAFPFALTAGRAPASLERLLPAMPLYRQAGRVHLDAILRDARPQVVACVGRVAFETVASVAENRLTLAAELAEEGWEGLVLAHEYAEGLSAYPRGEFRGFRARLVPVADLEDASPALAGHARDTLFGLLRDAFA